MSRIKPESLPKPKKVSKTQAKSLYTKFTSTGNSKYDVYVEAAKELNPGEALSVMVLPENVITSIQKKFRERGLTTKAGYYAVSKTLGSEEKGKKSLLIGRYASKPAPKPNSKKSTAPKSSSRASKKSTTSGKATTASRTARSKAAPASKAVKASRAKKSSQTVARKASSTRATKKVTRKAGASKTTAKKTTPKVKVGSNGVASTPA